jgi:hypothetical protein
MRTADTEDRIRLGYAPELLHERKEVVDVLDSVNHQKLIEDIILEWQRHKRAASFKIKSHIRLRLPGSIEIDEAFERIRTTTYIQSFHYALLLVGRGRFTHDRPS